PPLPHGRAGRGRVADARGPQARREASRRRDLARPRAAAGQLLPGLRPDLPARSARGPGMKLQPRSDPALAAELNELLERRAQRVRQRPAREEQESVLWVAEFPVGEERYAIPLQLLRAAVPLRM